jgi:hypothetical protein
MSKEEANSIAEEIITQAFSNNSESSVSFEEQSKNNSGCCNDKIWVSPAMICQIIKDVVEAVTE